MLSRAVSRRSPRACPHPIATLSRVQQRTMNSEIDCYLADLERRRGASPHTVKNYGLDLTHAAEWLRTQGVEDWQVVERRHVRAWVAWMHAEGYAATSIGRKLSALRSLYRFLARAGL